MPHAAAAQTGWDICQKIYAFFLHPLLSIRFCDKMGQLHAENDFNKDFSCKFTAFKGSLISMNRVSNSAAAPSLLATQVHGKEQKELL